MTPNHDHATLFKAAAPPAEEDTGQAGRVADDGAEAMRALRDPFATHPADNDSTDETDRGTS
jgi:hypothetical protein